MTRQQSTTSVNGSGSRSSKLRWKVIIPIVLLIGDLVAAPFTIRIIDWELRNLFPH